MLEFIQDTDWSILHFIRDALHCGVLDYVMPRLTLLGNGGIIWIIAAVAMVVSKKYRKHGVILLLGLLLGLLVGNVALKNIVERERPCWSESVQLLISNPKDYSFPSGHTLSSVIAAFVITSADKRFGFIAVPLASLIAFSRLYLYVHFPSDVIAAAVLGVLIGWFTVHFLGKGYDRLLLKKHAEAAK